MNTPTVVCVLRGGGVFKSEHVTQLYAAIEYYWPSDRELRFAVLTDYDVTDFPGLRATLIPLKYSWHGWWAKMELFRGDLLWLGDILFFDLDTVIVGDLIDIAAVGNLTCLDDFYAPAKLGSGLMYLPQERRMEVWNAWDMGKAQGRLRGDQDFLRKVWSDEQRWQRILPGQVVSYKVHVRKAKRVPEGARVVCFHGRPRPWEVDEKELY
jgi:hypothetical protein